MGGGCFDADDDLMEGRFAISDVWWEAFLISGRLAVMTSMKVQRSDTNYYHRELHLQCEWKLVSNWVLTSCQLHRVSRDDNLWR